LKPQSLVESSFYIRAHTGQTENVEWGEGNEMKGNKKFLTNENIMEREQMKIYDPFLPFFAILVSTAKARQVVNRNWKWRTKEGQWNRTTKRTRTFINAGKLYAIWN